MAHSVKQFLLRMSPLLPYDCYDEVLAIMRKTDPAARVAALHTLITGIEPQAQAMLAHLCRLIITLWSNPNAEMTLQKIAFVFTPILIRPPKNRMLGAIELVSHLKLLNQAVEEIVANSPYLLQNGAKQLVLQNNPPGSSSSTSTSSFSSSSSSVVSAQAGAGGVASGGGPNNITLTPLASSTSLPGQIRPGQGQGAGQALAPERADTSKVRQYFNI